MGSPRSASREEGDRVVVTGLGAVSAAGPGVEALFAALLERKVLARPVRSFDTGSLDVHVACEATGFASDPATPAEGGRATALARAAAREALADAGLAAGEDFSGEPKAGVAVGSTLGELLPFEEESFPWGRPETATRAAGLPARAPHGIAERLARTLRLEGPVLTLLTACAAGNYAVAWAAREIRGGRVPAMLAGGTDAFSRLAFLGFARLGAMSPDLCRPFSAGRRGLLLGEGAAFLVLESLASARRRGARVRAELLGAGVSADAHHITAPDPDGRGAALAMERALVRAAIAPGDLDWVSAHGTGTHFNDRTETAALKRVLGPHAARVPVSSNKGVLGHSMGAASALESVAAVLALERQVILPTANFEGPDPDCDLDYVTEGPRRATLRVVLNHASGFGGNNCAVVLAAAGAAAGAAG